MKNVLDQLQSIKASQPHSVTLSLMAPIAVQYSVGGCQYKTPEAELELATQLLRIHTDAVHVGQVGNVHQPIRPEKVRRPQLVVKEGFVTENRWLF